MRSRVKYIGKRILHNLKESGTDITLAWNEWPANVVVDEVTKVPTTDPTPKREVVKAFLHYVSATASVRQFVEIQVGDCILDLDPALNLKSRESLTFLLPSGPDNALETWTNKPISNQLSAFWDAQAGGQRLFQTVLVRKAA